MRIARVTGTVTSSAKDVRLSGIRLLTVDVEDGSGSVSERGLVAADGCSAKANDVVLVAFGSSARLAADMDGVPIDACAVAHVDRIDFHSASSSDVVGSSAKKRRR